MASESRRKIARGDRVELRRDGPGTVVAVIGERPLEPTAAARHWERLGRGIVVQLDSGTVVHIREPGFELVSDGP